MFDWLKKKSASKEAEAFPVHESVTQSQIDRKKRSIATLKSGGIPVLNTLPFIEDEAEVTFRSLKELSNRMYALAAVSDKGCGAPEDIVEKIIQEFSVDSFTPAEQNFIDDPEPSYHQRVQFAWRSEALYVLTWALGYVDELPYPDEAQTSKDIWEPFARLKREEFEANAKLRTASELLDEADLIYRYHWAVTDARLNGRPMPGSLNQSVVLERQYALNWLVGYMGQSWDDVSTDT
ncbi:DUF4272 domain-containing protein [Hellea balneolensis]|uniref:DUF4272 domain-containing protein n=1 Tax=Hellea balneolensis TaxID=287478 RepID=UPI000556340D|nr:DUF4272 domain-containing protein [Hellea balneolensis]